MGASKARCPSPPREETADGQWSARRHHGEGIGRTDGRGVDSERVGRRGQALLVMICRAVGDGGEKGVGEGEKGVAPR